MKFHKITQNEWGKLNIVEQMANVGSEVSRTINWKRRSKEDAEISFRRALELLLFTIMDPKNKVRLSELTRVKETLCDWYTKGGKYSTTDNDWQKYFLEFAIASRINR